MELELLNTLPVPAVAIANEQLTTVNTAFQQAFPNACHTGSLAECLTLAEGESTDSGCWHSALWQASDSSNEPYDVLIRFGEADDNGHQVAIVLCLNQLSPCVPNPAIEATIEQLSQKHRDFVSVVSHEFRTPLTSIKGFADTLLRYGGNLNEEQRNKFITTIKEQADRLTRMVENLLTVSKLGEGTVQVECRTVPLEAMLERVITNIEAKGSQDPLYTNRAIQLNLPDKLPSCWADPDKLEQVLTNIIDNAVKYAFANSTIIVAPTIDENDTIAIAVTNEGEGIGKDQLPKIFKRFSRADNPLTRNVEGTGLGLYITRNLITAMDGDITVDSEPGKTTTFTIRIPTVTDERQAAWHAARDSQLEGGE